jgi:hypothetical protein
MILKTIKTIFCIVFSSTLVLSQQLIKEGVVKSQIVTVVPGSTDPIPPILMTSWLKGSKLKVSQKNEYANNSIYYDRKDGRVVTLYEIMGKKIGFYVYDTMNSYKRKMLDSVVVTLMDSSQVINDFNCKMAILQYPKSLKQNDVEVWYCKDVRFNDENMGLTVLGLSKLDGATISFKTVSQNNLQVKYEVTGIDTSSSIEDKEFVIPREYEVMTVLKFQLYMNQRASGL